MSKYDFQFDLYKDDTLSWIANEIKEGTKVLEFGAANGRLTRFLKQSKKCTVDIVEIDVESGTEAARYANKAFVGDNEGDIEKYQWIRTGENYDYIVFADVLEHLVNPQEVLKRCKSVISKTGKILVSVPNISHNSIIIELMNDRFNYNPIGLLDNTHLRFFTRQSFIRMAEQTGWAVVGEKPRYIRVGENEIQNSYADVSKEVFKELIQRETGNVYQYMFMLALSSEYLLGNCERVVCMDGFSHYYAEALYENEGQYDYRKQVSRYINPGMKRVDIVLTVLGKSKKVLIHPMNCNCVVQIGRILTRSQGRERIIDCFVHNAVETDGVYCFFEQMPQIEFELQDDDTEILLEMEVLAYDFDAVVIRKMCDSIQKRQRLLEKSQREFQESAEKYEEMIAQKDKEFRESAEKYEEMIARKDKEFQESAEKYEEMIARKDKEFQESAEKYEEMVARKDKEFQESAEKYEEMIAQKDKEFQESAERYEEMVARKTKEF